ncbi:MAG: DGQHR domain-containing protein [Ignavibacteriaceae bacterium]|nr:DGQHR domain-containing protein [Ignavibacteriaceae bacterium]
MKISDLLDITYVAARGKSTEQGAVQRVLNKQRISLIRKFILEGNLFVNTFILNWTDTDNSPKIKKDSLNIPLQGRRAQILDGQHRIEGLREAVTFDQGIKEKEVLVSLAIGLTTKEAAKIFLNINSEQKPVPKSLIYDLFGEAIEDKEHAINRATDLIEFLNTHISSPFYQRIKYPGSPKGTGLIDLAIIVNAIKPHLGVDGVFHRLQLHEIEVQQRIIINYYNAIKKAYQKANNLWDKSTENPFIKGAGFNGSFEFLVETLIPKCQADKNFSQEYFEEIMKLEPDFLITTSNFRNLDGKTARKSVKSFFNECFTKDIPKSDEYKF